ncbi:MAG: hypothetical protein QOK37_3594 [Thermoanaerobaculia bacterium]|jgi:hypothetical protein|nr:hypothetical protein [Thermoanaerobaculia bacterium]
MHRVNRHAVLVCILCTAIVVLTATPLLAQFGPVLNPSSLTFPSGSSGQFTASTAKGPPLPELPIVITFTAPAAVTITPPTASLTAANYLTGVRFTASSSTPGTYSILVRFQVVTAVRLEETATLTVTVKPVIVPAINAVAPPSIVAPSLNTTFRVGGINFAPGGVVFSRTPGVVIERTKVFSPTLAEIVVRIPAGTPPGPLRLGFRNPDGGTSERDGVLLVYRRGSIGAPLTVNSATIVFPVTGTIVASSDAVYPRALLGVSGSGTVTGSWAIDGTPYDRFTATTKAGAPLQVKAHSPIPPTAWGQHRLSLIIESPKLDQAPSVLFESSLTSATRLTIYEPVERSIVEGRPRIRWTLMPGASAYEVEIVHRADDGRELGRRRFRSTETLWSPTDLGSGTMQVRVRTIYQGDTKGEPTQWRTFVLLPPKALLKIDGAESRRVAWSGGSLGMIYRLEFLRGGASCFGALSFASPYRLPDSIPWRQCDAVRVEAFAPSGKLLGRSQDAALQESFAPPVSLAANEETPELIERLPVATVLSDGFATVAARWRSGPQTDSALLVDDIDVTAVSLRQARAIVYNALLPLESGRHVAALASPGALDEWAFSVDEDQAPSASSSPSPLPRAYVIDLSGKAGIVRARPVNDQATDGLELSMQGKIGDAVAGDGVQATGDLAYAGTIDPNRFVQASRNWEGLARKTYGRMWASSRVGYTLPDFTDGAEFLTSGTARTGVVARAGSDWGTLSYYQPIDPAVHGVLSASPESLGIRSAAFSTPDGKPYVLRVIALRVKEPLNLLLSTPETTTRTFGIFGSYKLGTTGVLSAEAAHGSVKTQTGPLVSRSGDAIRVTANGVFAGTTYSADLRSVDANYVNPGNRSLTPGIGQHFVFGRTIGLHTLSLSLGRQEQGRESNSPLQHATATAIGLSATSNFNPSLSLVTTLGIDADHADAQLSTSSPATSRRNSLASAALTETFSKLNVAETLSWTRLDDHKSPLANQDVTSILVAVGGAPITNVSLVSSAGFTRTKATPIIGTTDAWTVSLTPSIAFPQLSLSVLPSVNINRSTNDVTASHTRSESYGSIVQWQPGWRSSLFSGQVSAVTTHTAISMMPSTRTNVYAATITVHLRKTEAMPMFALPAPLPGTQPPAPPSDTTSGPTTADSPAAKS